MDEKNLIIPTIFPHPLPEYKYPFGQILRNSRGIFKNGKKRKIIDLSRKAGKPKKASSKVGIRHIRRNKEKSPVRSLFSFLQAHK